MSGPHWWDPAVLGGQLRDRLIGGAGVAVERCGPISNLRVSGLGSSRYGQNTRRSRYLVQITDLDNLAPRNERGGEPLHGPDIVPQSPRGDGRLSGSGLVRQRDRVQGRPPRPGRCRAGKRVYKKKITRVVRCVWDASRRKTS